MAVPRKNDATVPWAKSARGRVGGYLQGTLPSMNAEDRRRLYRSFRSRWSHPDYPPEPEAEEILAEVEQQLGLALPLAYRQYMREIGPLVSSPEMLHAVREGKLAVRDMSEFHAGRDVGRATLAWRRSNLPKELVTIASDGSGNQFCLRLEAVEGAASDTPVWIWLHETDTAEPVAESFDGWLAELAAIEPDRGDA